MELIDRATLALRLKKSVRTIDRQRHRFEFYAVGPSGTYPRFRWDAIVRDIESGVFPKLRARPTHGRPAR